MSYVNYIESDPYLDGPEQFDPYELYIENMEFMAEEAKTAMEKRAVSYRNVLVGSALMAYNDDIQDMQIFVGANYKPFKGAPKKCAEMDALNKMNALNFELDQQFKEGGPLMGLYRPTGLVTVSNASKEVIRSVNGITSPTLHMCKDCQCYFKNDPLVDENKLINTTLPESLRYMEVRRLSDYCNEVIPDTAIEIARKVVGLTLDFKGWVQITEYYRELMDDYSGRSEMETLVPSQIAIEAILSVRRSGKMPESFPRPQRVQ